MLSPATPPNRVGLVQAERHVGEADLCKAVVEICDKEAKRAYKESCRDVERRYEPLK